MTSKRPAVSLLSALWLLGGCQREAGSEQDGAAVREPAVSKGSTASTRETKDGGLAPKGQATAGLESLGTLGEQENLGKHAKGEPPEAVSGQSDANPAKPPVPPPLVPPPADGAAAGDAKDAGEQADKGAAKEPADANKRAAAKDASK